MRRLLSLSKSAATAAALVCATAGAALASEGGEGGNDHLTAVVFQAINLAVLLFIIVKYAKDPMRRSLEARAAQVTKDIDEAARLNAEASARLKDYEGKLSGLQKAADDLLAELRHEGEAEKARLIAEAQADAERIRREAERAAETEIARVRARLETELAEQAIDAAGRIVREKLVPADHRRLAGEYLSRLEERA